MQSAPNEKIRYRSECQQIRPQKGGSDSVPFAKKIGTSITCSDMVAGAGFEPHDLRVMSPTSYRTAPPRDINKGFPCFLFIISQKEPFVKTFFEKSEKFFSTQKESFLLF